VEIWEEVDPALPMHPAQHVRFSVPSVVTTVFGVVTTEKVIPNHSS